MIIRAKATPNAKQSQWMGWESGPLLGPLLRVKIQSPPIDGKANKELRQFLAKNLNTQKAKIRLIKGVTSRIKTFEVPDDVDLPDKPAQRA